MPRTEEANQLIRDERRRQLLDAAAGVFARNGFAGTRIEDIAAVSGTSKGLIYHYFGGKEAVFQALIQGAVQGSMRLFDQARARPGTASERLKWLIEQELAGLSNDRHSFMVILQAFTSDAAPQEARDLVSELGKKAREVTSELITAGQQEGQVVPGDPEQLANLLHSCIQGLAVSAAAPDLWPHPTTADSLVNLFLP